MAVGVDQAAALSNRLRPDERSQLLEAVGEALGRVPPLSDLALAWARPDYGAVGTVGFVAGFCDGFLDGADHWASDLKRLLRLVGIGTVVGVTEFFVRPIVEDDPTGLLPQTQEALESLNAVRVLGPVARWLDTVGPVEALATLRDLMPTAGDLAVLIGRAAGDWLLGLVAKAVDPYAAGRYVGVLVGRVVLELVRAVIEPDAFALGAALETPLPTGQESAP